MAPIQKPSIDPVRLNVLLTCLLTFLSQYTFLAILEQRLIDNVHTAFLLIFIVLEEELDAFVVTEVLLAAADDVLRYALLRTQVRHHFLIL